MHEKGVRILLRTLSMKVWMTMKRDHSLDICNYPRNLSIIHLHPQWYSNKVALNYNGSRAMWLTLSYKTWSRSNGDYFCARSLHIRLHWSWCSRHVRNVRTRNPDVPRIGDDINVSWRQPSVYDTLLPATR